MKMIDLLKEVPLKCAVKVEAMKNTVKNQQGISTLELLVILGVAILIIGVTYGVSKDDIASWWENKVATYWQ